MGDITTSGLDPRTAPLRIRPAATDAVRAADPTKERFQVGERKVANSDAGTVEQDQLPSFTVDADESGVFVSPARGRAGRGLLGAFTSFLAKMFTQGDNGADTAASTRLTGIGAYGQANTQQRQAAPLSGFAADIQAPGLPRLASGRVLDLSV